MQLVPAVTSVEMAAVDQAMVEGYGIDLIQTMENAGRALAVLARDRFLDGDPQGKTVVVLAGPGGNGGGALVAGRRLHGWGATVRTVLAREPDRFAPVPAKQLAILDRLGVEILSSGQLLTPPDSSTPDLVIDGVIGYSLRGAPPRRGRGPHPLVGVDGSPDPRSGCSFRDGRHERRRARVHGPGHRHPDIGPPEDGAGFGSGTYAGR